MSAPATGAATTPSTGSSATQLSVPSKTESATAAFSKLSSQHPGYVTSEDAAKLQGFDFKSADKNNDGKLDQAEFDAAWRTYTGAK